MSKFIGDVSAYAYAVSKGYTGTEEEFAELMADYAEVGQRAEDAADRAEAALEEFTTVTADAYTLPEGSSATANYDSGLLTFGIPKGDKGDGAVYVRATSDAVHIDCDSDGVVKHTRNVEIGLECYKGERQITIQMLRQLPSIALKDGTYIEPIIDLNMDNITGFHYMVEEGTEIAETIANGYTQKYRITAKDGSDTYTLYENLTIVVLRDGAKGDKGDTGDKGDKGDKGDTGNTGNTPNLTIGTVTTLQPTAPATATISGTADNPVLSFGIPKGDTGEVSQDQFDAALALKADAIGNYPELAVGTAEQIDSDTVVAEDVAPYQFRQSISGASNRAYDKIVGGSLAVNQLVRNGDFSNGSDRWSLYMATAAFDNNIATVVTDDTVNVNSGGSLIQTGITVFANHKYIVSATIKGDGEHRTALRADGGFSFNAIVNVSNDFKTFDGIAVGVSDPSSGRVVITAYGPSMTILVKNVKLFDLTAMFGSTIADYVYGLETATAGAGVDWLKSHFPRIFNAGYVPYNAGELVSVQASAHKMTGFNQWDEEWEVGAISGGQPAIGYTNCIRSKNFCKCFPNTKYYLKCGDYTNNYYAALHWYDADKKFISVIYTAAFETTSPANARYFKMSTNASTYLYGNVYNNDICINISSSRNGEYEPYEEHSYPLDDSLELRGIPKLDADNNLVYDGDVYESTGNVARKYGIVDLGTLTWTYYASYSSMVAPVNGKYPYSDSYFRGLLCDKYPVSNYWWTSGDKPDKTISNGANTNICVKDSAYTDAATFETAMSGVYLVYELATPTTEEADPYTVPQIVDPDGTEEYVSTSIVPVGHESRYPLDIAGRLDKILTMPTANGTYTLRATVNNGAVTYAWVST